MQNCSWPPLLEEPARAQTKAERRQQAVLERRAEQLCLDCPLMVDCLYRAVVNHEVAGYCAGTTQQQRSEMRRRLGVSLAPENLDVWTGTSSGHRVNHEEILRLRTADPTAPLDSIAQRMNCSVSTVKRHLRRARQGATAGRKTNLEEVPPSVEQVLAAYREVVMGDNTPASQCPGEAA
ncbi:MAG: WhiB family transcriptional regulator [Brooklawnia sp.]